jgi:hypothetical protein
VPFSRWRSRYLACFSALVKAMDAVPGALQSVTGNLSVGRKQALRCRRESRRPLPKRRQILTAAHRRRRTSGAEHQLHARFRIFPREGRELFGKPHHPVWNHRPRRRSGDVRLYRP